MDLSTAGLHTTLAQTSARWPDKIALIAPDCRCAYADLDRQSSQLAAFLVRQGLAPGDRVAVFTDSRIETVIALYGIARAGGVFVILNSGLKAPKLTYILENSGARVLITQATKSRIVTESVHALDRDLSVICIDHDRCPAETAAACLAWEPIFDTAAPATALPPTNPDQLAALIYTSGSTGRPKGVMSSHRSMLAAAGSIIEYLENTPDDIILNVLPLSFDYGLYQVLMSVCFGGTVVLEPSFVYLHRVLEQIGHHRVTGFPIVPTIAAMLLKMENLQRYDFRSLRYLTNTGAAFPSSHIQRLRRLLPDVAIYSMFGLTECKRVCYLPPDQIDLHPDSVGRPMPRCETWIVDENDRPVEPGQVGELVIEGPNVMQGYWGDAELTARTFRASPTPGRRRLYSGDYFKQDAEGYLYFLGRKDDMIKTRGERVSPREVENGLMAIDGIAEAAAVGVPDAVLGQVIQAFVVLRDGAALTEQKILAVCTKTMENFLVPKYIVLVPDLPKNPHGKIDKKALIDRERTSP